MSPVVSKGIVGIIFEWLKLCLSLLLNKNTSKTYIPAVTSMEAKGSIDMAAKSATLSSLTIK